MSVVVYGAAAPTPTLAVTPVRGMAMTWTGADGVVWDLSNPSRGVFLAAEELLGLAEPPVEVFTSSSPALPGARYRGHRVLSRPTRWLVGVFAERGDWLTRARAFLDSVLNRGGGTWGVTFPDGVHLDLSMRYAGSPHAYGRDPLTAGWALYDLAFVADEEPYWVGAPVVEPFQASEPVPFLGPTGFGPPFYPSEASSLAGATITNPGDTDAWPVWSVRGVDDADPVTSIQVGVGGQVVAAAGLSLGVGGSLVIDAHPTRQSATLNGTRVRGLLSPHDFAPVPAGASVDLVVELVGKGVVEARIVPRFERAI